MLHRVLWRNGVSEIRYQLLRSGAFGLFARQ